MVRRFFVGLVVLAALAGADRSIAQGNPPPDGCSLPLPDEAKEGLDDLVLKACTRHDQCWRTPSFCERPNGFGLKAQCDALFLADLEAVCAAASWTMRAAGFPSDEVDEAWDDCSDAAFAMYAGVSVNLWTFAQRQCQLPILSRYEGTCSPDMCEFLAEFHVGLGRDVLLQRAVSCCADRYCPGHNGPNHIP